MAKTVLFEDVLNFESVGSLIEVLEEVDPAENITLYFACEGGSVAWADVLSDYLNSLTNRLTLVGVHELLSGGFDVMYHYKGAKRVLPFTHGLVHEASQAVASRPAKLPDSLEAVQIETIELMNTRYFEDYKGLLNESEQIRFKQGHDIIFDTTRMDSIFNKTSND